MSDAHMLTEISRLDRDHRRTVSGGRLTGGAINVGPHAPDADRGRGRSCAAPALNLALLPPHRAGRVPPTGEPRAPDAAHSPG